jgi:predicted lipid-binding transport protein (Tim44 family)
VFAGFNAAIDARIAAGETIDARLIRIEEARIIGASLEDRVARITVRFRADVASVTRDADGNVVAGSLDDAIETHDRWTFRRDLTSRDPDWLLDETDEA